MGKNIRQAKLVKLYYRNGFGWDLLYINTNKTLSNLNIEFSIMLNFSTKLALQEVTVDYKYFYKKEVCEVNNGKWEDSISYKTIKLIVKSVYLMMNKIIQPVGYINVKILRNLRNYSLILPLSYF